MIIFLRNALVIVNIDVILRYDSGLFQGMGSTNKKRRYTVTPSLIGWAHAQNDQAMLKRGPTVLGSLVS